MKLVEEPKRSEGDEKWRGCENKSLGRRKSMNIGGEAS
jgi:hypothetical protein